MDVDLILKVAGISMIITVVCQIMSKAGRDEQSTMVSLAGMVIILLLIAERVGELLLTLRRVFGFTSDICASLGESTLASLVLTVGRVEIFMLALPYFVKTVELGMELLS